MSVKIKIWVAKLRLFINKMHKQAQKLALAAVLLQYMIAGGWYFAESRGILNYFKPKTVFIEIAHAKEMTTEAKNKPESKDEAISRIMDEIWLNESTRGKNNYSKCKEIGRINGIGYGIYGGKWQCFDNHAEEFRALNSWITDHKAQGMTENELLCHYSGGNYKICNN